MGTWRLQKEDITLVYTHRSLLEVHKGQPHVVPYKQSFIKDIPSILLLILITG